MPGRSARKQRWRSQRRFARAPNLWSECNMLCKWHIKVLNDLVFYVSIWEFVYQLLLKILSSSVFTFPFVSVGAPRGIWDSGREDSRLQWILSSYQSSFESLLLLWKSLQFERQVESFFFRIFGSCRGFGELRHFWIIMKRLLYFYVDLMGWTVFYQRFVFVLVDPFGTDSSPFHLGAWIWPPTEPYVSIWNWDSFKISLEPGFSTYLLDDILPCIYKTKQVFIYIYKTFWHFQY